MSAPSPSHRKGLRAVAFIEALKGAIVLAVGFGLVALLGRDAEKFAQHVVQRLHLNPAHHYPHIFISAMASVDDARLLLLAALAAFYSLVRFIEAYGLWRHRVWAEWLAAFSGGIYVPIELFELLHGVTALKLAALTVNLVIVGYMVWLLTERRRLRGAAAT